ncbi:unnamed protein product [Rotaria sp. Silwood1]|nr:unnamed protein product [Rotaria sp. Silwood1]
MASINVFLMLLIVSKIHSFVVKNDQDTISQNGKSQSPIYVDLSQTNYVEYPSFLFSTGYHETTMFQVSIHNDETISITPILLDSTNLVVSGGCLSGVFTFQSAHLHWPKSEHRFNKKKYVAEAHFIHKNLDTNKTAVFAYFFTLINSQSYKNDDKMNNWEFIVQTFTNNTNMTIAGGLSSLMKGKKDRFIHYMGSLTTEPFTEGISWILVSSAMKLSDSSLNRLRTNVISSNYRLIQPLNDRLVYRSFPSTSWNT